MTDARDNIVFDRDGHAGKNADGFARRDFLIDAIRIVARLIVKDFVICVELRVVLSDSRKSLINGRASGCLASANVIADLDEINTHDDSPPRTFGTARK